MKKLCVLFGFVIIIFSLNSAYAEDSKINTNIELTSLHQWVINKMVSMSPPGRSYIKDAIESKEDGLLRYEEIADSAISVVYDENEKPIFRGEFGRARTLALLISVAWFESGFRKDVDLGVGELARGDNGKSWCMMQVNLGKPNPLTGKTSHRVVLTDDKVEITNDKSIGFGGEDLIFDRKSCFKVGLHMIRKSFNSCAGIALLDKLSVYGSGKCVNNMPGSRYRIQKAIDWFNEIKPPINDANFSKLLSDNTQSVNIQNIYENL